MKNFSFNEREFKGLIRPWDRVLYWGDAAIKCVLGFGRCLLTTCNYPFSTTKRYHNDISKNYTLPISEMPCHDVRSAKLTDIKFEL